METHKPRGRVHVRWMGPPRGFPIGDRSGLSVLDQGRTLGVFSPGYKDLKDIVPKVFSFKSISTTAPQPVALILGSGPRVGASVAAAFLSKGYSVATASRSGTGAKTPEGYLSLAADFANPASIPALFGSVKDTFGAAPSVVVYNAAGLTPPPDNDSVLTIPADRFVNDLNVNTVSPYIAAQKAVEGWTTLPGDVKKTFIYTGNPLNVHVAPMPLFLNLGVGKRESTYWIAVADNANAVKGYRFYYADERAEGGKSKGNSLDGPAHGEFYAQLASHKGNIPWHACRGRRLPQIRLNRQPKLGDSRIVVFSSSNKQYELPWTAE